jgi:transcription initiation factor TFIIIB Brf1 subunit/transcription initiation factor TFIIB
MHPKKSWTGNKVASFSLPVTKYLSYAFSTIPCCGVILKCVVAIIYVSILLYLFLRFIGFYRIGNHTHGKTHLSLDSILVCPKLELYFVVCCCNWEVDVMESVCPQCNDDSLEVENVGNSLVLVCTSCGYEINPGKENESTKEDDEDNEDDYDGEDEDAIKVNESYQDTQNKPTNETELSAGTSRFQERSPRKRSPEKAKAAAPTCKSCGSTEFEHETINETEQYVCTNCGYYIEKEELVFSNEYTTISGTSATYQWTRAPQPKFVGTGPLLTKGREAGLKRIKSLGVSLTLRPDVVEQATALFESLYTDRRIMSCSNSLKEALAACCIMSVARENRIGLTFKMLTSLHNAGHKHYSRALRLMAIVGNKVQPQSLSTLAQQILSGKGFSPQLEQKVRRAFFLCV